MIYREYKPSAILAPYIECYWSALSDKPPFRDRESLIPDGTIELMFNFGDPYTHLINEKEYSVKGSHFIGIRKESLIISQTKKQNFFSIRFKTAGTWPFFHIPVHLFSNGFFHIQEIVDNEFNELEEQLAESPDDQTKVDITEKFLLRRFRDNSPDYLFVSKCSSALLSGKFNRLKDLGSHFGTNYKKLERKFLNVTGLTPTEWIKINRFNRAILLMYSCTLPSLTQVGYNCGYYDQSHFIREFKQLTTFSPKEFLKQQFTIVQVIQPALAERLAKSYNI